MPAHQDSDTSGYFCTKLDTYCNANGLNQPVYHTASDRRGSRTAWSRSVEVGGQVFTARYWWDGTYIHNANEDAAEVALERLEAAQQMLVSQQQQFHQHQQYLQQQYYHSQAALSQNSNSGNNGGWGGQGQ